MAESARGAVGLLNLQDSFNGWTAGLEVVGDGQAVVAVDDLGRVSCREGGKRTTSEQSTWGNTAYTWEPHHTLNAWQRSGYGNQLRHFAECICGGAQPFPSLRDGWRNLVVGQCILEACAGRCVVDVPQGA